MRNSYPRREFQGGTFQSPGHHFTRPRRMYDPLRSVGTSVAEQPRTTDPVVATVPAQTASASAGTVSMDLR